MKPTRILVFALATLFFSVPSWAQKRLTEATIAYDIVINTSNETPQAADLLDGATSVIYLKGEFQPFGNDQFSGYPGDHY
jgi:hypothetical protein